MRPTVTRRLRDTEVHARRAALALGLTLLLAACSEVEDATIREPEQGRTPVPAPAETPGSSRWTVSEQGAGPVRVGMTLDETRNVLGGRLRSSPSPDPGCDYVFPEPGPAGVAFMVVGGRIARVDVDTAGIRTATGAEVGDTEAWVRALHPGLRTEPHKYTAGRYLVVVPADTTRRIIFETDGERVVRYRAGRLPEVEWVEGCS